MITFLISIIGPNTRNAMTAPIGSCAEKLRPTTASLEEHSDSKNASAIIESSGSKRPLLFVSGSFFVRLCMMAETNAPAVRYFPTVKNSVCVWRR